MKQKLFLIILCVSSSYIHAQDAFRLDSLKLQNWESTTNNWLDNFKRHYYYDSAGVKNTSEYQFLYQNNVWDSISRTFKAYNGNANLEQEQIQGFNMNDWTDIGRNDYAYTAENRIDFKSQFIPVGMGQWLENDREEYTYDTSGNNTELLFKILDAMTFQLVNNKRRLHSYTGALVQEDIFQIWASNIWLNTERRQYTYNANNLIALIDKSVWEAGQTWSAIIERSIFSYDANNLATEVLTQVPGGNDFVNESRIVNTYDSEPNLIQVMSQEWNGSNWVNLGNLIQNYDANNNIEEQITQIWDTGNWLNQERVLSYWSPAESLSVAFLDSTNTIKLYPNPTTDILQVTFKESTKTPLKATLYNVLGKTILTKNIPTGLSSFKLSLQEKAKGLYLLEIQENVSKQVYRIVKK